MFKKSSSRIRSVGITIFITAALCITALGEEKTFPGSTSDWNGFTRYDFSLENVKCIVVAPKTTASGKPWVWRARFFGHEPQFDIAMLNHGYHVVYCDVADLYGNQEAINRWNEFYNFLRLEHLFADRAVLVGFSRGGLIVYNWAAHNPEKVAVIYGDAPVMDFKSWPKINSTIMRVYGFKDKAEAEAWPKNPVDNLAPLAKAKIPIIHVVGDADMTVPVSENTAIAEERYKMMGGEFKVINKPGVGHHPHSLKDPQPIVDFVLKHNQGMKTVTAENIVSANNFILRGNFNNSRIQFERNKKGHVAFIGGSITEMNGYRPMVCKILEKRFPETEFSFTAAGISSTCSDTGAFRLNRDVLAKGPLDMLFVEFAVNDDQDGALSRENSIRGMEGIIAQARAHNPNVDIVMTFFVNESILKILQNGEKPVSIQAHSDVAAQHGVSVNNLAQELADLITADKMDWKRFGGVHPNDFGNTMCATMISNALLKEWSKPLPENAELTPHAKTPLLDPKSYAKGRFIPLEDVTINKDWQLSVPEWKNDNLGDVRSRFLGKPFIHSNKAGAKLSLKFSGTAIGAYILAGPDAAIVRCKVDGGETKDIDTIHKHSGFHYPRTVMFFNDLNDGEHVLELEILENQPNRIRKGGTALRVMNFTAN